MYKKIYLILNTYFFLLYLFLGNMLHLKEFLFHISLILIALHTFSVRLNYQKANKFSHKSFHFIF